ncbi:major capsid protein [Paenibacillus larvae]|nr:major capsid protein [Paenibacillus larvae]MDT2243124.1 major capsid protein [Paenibacillus larvae]
MNSKRASGKWLLSFPHYCQVRLWIVKGIPQASLSRPLIKPMRAITSIDLNKKLFGQNPFETSSPEERAQELLARDLVELDDYITRREWMRAQLLFTGKVIQKVMV